MDDINGCLDSDIWSVSYNQKQYGCHRPHVPLHLSKPKEQVCVYCHQKQPGSLEDMALYQVLKDSQLVQKVETVLSHMPDRLFAMIGRAINANYYGKAVKLVELMSGDGEPRRSVFDVNPRNQIVLTRFLFYSSVYRKLKPFYMEDSSDVICEIVQYLRNIGTNYKDFWSTMNSLTKRFDETIKKEETNLLSTDATDADGSKIVYVNTPTLIGSNYEPILQQAKREYKQMKDLQKLNKTTSCPVIFRTRCIMYPCLKARDIPSLLEDIDPQDITEVDLTVTASWSVDKIHKLGQVLSVCSNLSCISLWQTTTNMETPENLALDLSKLFGFHSPLLKIKLGGIPLGGTMEQYPLPPAEEWFLSNCNLMETDWQFMAGRSDLALKVLSLSSEYNFSSHPSLPSFIQKQATSLEKLSLQDLTLAPIEVCNLVNDMAQFSKLQELRLNCDDMDATSLENLVVAFMSITSAKKLFCEMSTQRIYNEKKEPLNQAMNKFCAANRRPPIFLSTMARLQHLHISTQPKWDD